MSLKAQVEALIYAAEEPITLEQLALLLKDAVLAERAAARANAAARNDADADNPPAGDAPGESMLLPELDAAWEEELSGLDPEGSPQHEPFWEDDEPFFAMDTGAMGATALSEFPEDRSPEADSSDEDLEAASSLPAPESSAAVAAPETAARKRQPKKSGQEIADDKLVRARLREVLAELVADYAGEERGMEIRPVAGGFRMATKPEHHDLVRAFAKGLKPPIRLSLAALETLAVIAYKQPVTAPEIADIRGVDSAGVLGTLLDRKLITTAGRKQVIGRPMQYKTSKDFLLRFGLNDLNELPSMEEFSQLAFDSAIEDSAGGDATPELPTAEAQASTSQGQASQSQSADDPGSLPEAADSLGQ